MRRAAIVPVVLLLTASACSSGPSGPQAYGVAVDARSPAGGNIQYSSYFPSSIDARPGDSVVFENESSQAPHTITFGVNADRSNSPPVILPTGVENPAVLEPCYIDDDPSAKLTKCPTKAGKTPPEYSGSGYWNSGFLVPAVAPEGPKTIRVKLASGIAPGTYRYLCVLHPPMSGAITVVGDDGDRLTGEEVADQGRVQIGRARTAANAIPVPDAGVKGATATVAAGWGKGQYAINRFAPKTIEVESGTTVSWKAFDPSEPHTVSFGPTFKDGVPAPGTFAPSGRRSGSAFPGGTANSGIFGAGGPFPKGPFVLRFTRPGTYAYVCVLHPGMTGKVKVS